MAYVNLHNHSCYSFLDGKSTPEEMILTAKSLGQNAVAITDHGNMHAVYEFYKMGKKHGVKPVIGCEVYVAPGSRLDKTGEAFSGEGGRNYYHLILLCKNNEGYKNLCKMLDVAYEDGYYYKPRVDIELLEKYHEGLIASTACIGSVFSQTLIGETYTGTVTEENYQKTLEIAKQYQKIFGKENFYIELQNHGIPEEVMVIPYLERIAKEIGADCIVANDAHYASPEDFEAHDVMLCINTDSKINDDDRFRFSSNDFYLKSETQMAELFPGKQEYLDNTQKIAEKCNVNLDPTGYKLPKFPVPKEFEGRHGDYLKQVCKDNFEKLYPDGKGWTKEHKERFDKEFEVIESMGFIDYFLIVWDYINWARKQGIYIGPSRGSAGSSLICYMMGITQRIDPMEYGLIFER